jgi:hypothetical protein
MSTSVDAETDELLERLESVWREEARRARSKAADLQPAARLPACHQFHGVACRSPAALAAAILDTALGLSVKKVAFATELGLFFVQPCRYHIEGSIYYRNGKIDIYLHLCVSAVIATICDTAMYSYADTNDLSEVAQDAADRFWERTKVRLKRPAAKEQVP